MNSLTPPLRILAAAVCLLSSSASAQNLISNWDFSDNSFEYGNPYPAANYLNPGFTSDYAPVVPDEIGTLVAEGVYSIGSNANISNQNFFAVPDYTGDGNMLIVNGAVGLDALNDIVWQVDLPTISAGTTYFFEAHCRNINDPASWGGDLDGWNASQAILQFQVFDNGVWQPLSNIIDFTNPLVDSEAWVGTSNIWNSGANTSTSLRLVNLQTAANGNDFALDGMNFGTISIVPEPGSLLLVALAPLILCSRRRRLA